MAAARPRAVPPAGPAAEARAAQRQAKEAEARRRGRAARPDAGSRRGRPLCRSRRRRPRRAEAAVRSERTGRRAPRAGGSRSCLVRGGLGRLDQLRQFLIVRGRERLRFEQGRGGRGGRAVEEGADEMGQSRGRGPPSWRRWRDRRSAAPPARGGDGLSPRDSGAFRGRSSKSAGSGRSASTSEALARPRR